MIKGGKYIDFDAYDRQRAKHKRIGIALTLFVYAMLITWLFYKCQSWTA